jgi:hypothetical protein
MPATARDKRRSPSGRDQRLARAKHLESRATTCPPAVACDPEVEGGLGWRRDNAIGRRGR